MEKYEKVYAFNVIDEIKKNNRVYIVDRSACDNSNAIRCANCCSMGFVCKVLEHNNEDNRYEFFKVVKTDE